MRILKLTVLAVCLSLIMASAGAAQILDGEVLWSYQGRLDENGIPVVDGMYPMEFRIFDIDVGGVAFWSESQMVQVTDGTFNVLLGSAVPFPTWYLPSVPRWLEVVVNGETLTPRTMLASVPSAYAAGRVRGDIQTGLGHLFVSYPAGSDPDSLGTPETTVTKIELSARPTSSSLNLQNTSAIPENVTLSAGPGGLAMSFDYDALDRLTANVNAGTTDLVLVQYQLDTDTSASMTSTVGDGLSIQRLHVPTPAGGMSCVLQKVDQSTSSSEYDWESPVETNSVAIDADTAGASATLGSVLLDDGWQIDLQTHNDYGTMGIRRMDAEILQMRGDPMSTNQTLYHRIPIGDSISGVSEEADANGARLIVSDYGNGEATLEADTGGAALTLGLVSVDPMLVELKNSSGHARLGLIYDERDLIGLHANPLSSAQSTYFRIPAGDSTSGITQTADATGARLMVSDYGVSGTDGVTLSTGSSGSLISIAGVGSGGVPGLVLREDRIRLGSLSTATPNTVAMGTRAKANHPGSFVLADMSAMDLATTASDQFLVRAAGGTTIYSNSIQTTGVSLAANGGQWDMISDSTLKRNIQPVDGAEVLAKLSAVPVSRWNYANQADQIQHIGPMAQDFYAAFGLGGDETRISSLDPSGVALAAIKELDRRTQRIAELEAELRELRALVEKLAASE